MAGYFYPIFALVSLLFPFPLFPEYKICLSANIISFAGKPAAATSEIGLLHSGDASGSSKYIQKIV